MEGIAWWQSGSNNDEGKGRILEGEATKTKVMKMKATKVKVEGEG